jgi:hypothetical protein
VNEYRVLFWKREVKRPLERSRRKWKYNIRVNGYLWTVFLWLKMMKN